VKRFVCISLVLALVLFVAACSVPTVTFNDPALESKVRSALSKPEGKITIAEAGAVKELDLSNEWQPNIPQSLQIKDISALKHFANLTHLTLNFNAISDIVPLAGLTQLVSLNLGGNSVSDVKALANLSNLRELQIWGNREIADISPLASLVNLNMLSVGGLQISDISVVAKMRQLNVLFASNNQISDLTPLAGLPLRVLMLSGNPIDNYSPIKDIYTQLEEKDFELLSADSVPDTPLVFADLQFEKALRMAMNILDRPITVKDAFLVQALFIGNDKTPGSAFADISPLAHFVNLTSLEFNGNNISNLEPLKGLTKLKLLKVPFNKISDLQPLTSLSELETLELNNNQISDVSALSGLQKLRFLSLRDNPIQDFSPLKSIYPNLASKDFELK